MPRRKIKRELNPANSIAWSYVLRYNSLSIYDSAFKHGVQSLGISHAHTYAIAFFEISSGNPEKKLLIIGPDTAGNLLELIGVVTRDDVLVIIHAMPIRGHFHELLEESLGHD